MTGEECCCKGGDCCCGSKDGKCRCMECYSCRENCKGCRKTGGQDCKCERCNCGEVGKCGMGASGQPCSCCSHG